MFQLLLNSSFTEKGTNGVSSSHFSNPNRYIHNDFITSTTTNKTILLSNKTAKMYIMRLCWEHSRFGPIDCPPVFCVFGASSKLIFDIRCGQTRRRQRRPSIIQYSAIQSMVIATNRTAYCDPLIESNRSRSAEIIIISAYYVVIIGYWKK